MLRSEPEKHHVPLILGEGSAMETSELGLAFRVNLQSSYGKGVQGRKQIFHCVRPWRPALGRGTHPGC